MQILQLLLKLIGEKPELLVGEKTTRNLYIYIYIK
jgi:hypothetical protein